MNRHKPTLRIALIIGCLALVAAACGGDSSDSSDDAATAAAAAPAGDATNGEALFGSTCATCHGPDAMGLPGLGKGLVANDFVATMTEQELVAFISVGRPADDPANEAGVAMPPKGGNPALTDGDLLDIVAYLETLQ